MAEVVGIGVIQVEAESSGFEAAMVRLESAAKRAEASITQSLGKAAGAPANVGKEAAEAAKQNEAATTRFEQAMQRRTAALVGGVAKEREVFAQQKNLNAGAKEQISIYREVEQATEAVTKAKQKQAQADAYLAQLADRANRQTKTGVDYERGNAAAFGPETAKAAEKYIQALHGASNATRDLRVQTNLQKQAFQQLPAQITDIVTSLGSGQSVFTVLLQQGGQIKDSFGGIGNAFKSIGKAAVEFLTPARLAIGGLVGAIAAIGFGVVKGAAELTAFRTALALTGNAAGTTVGALNASARAISGLVGTQGKAAETLAALAGTGRVAAKDLGLLAEAAIRLEREGGPAVEETVKQFAELGRTPTQSVAKLNESTRFLTFSLYEQIKALENQGKTAEAASLAQNAYADAGVTRTKELEKNLGLVEKATRAVADGAKSMWDAVLNVGRPSNSGPEQRLATLQKELAYAEQQLAKAPPASIGVPAIKEHIEALKEQIKAVGGVTGALKELAQANRDVAAASLAAVRLSDSADQFKSPSQKLKEALAKSNEDQATARRPLLAAGDTASAARELDAFEAKYAKHNSNIALYSEAGAIAVAVRMQRIANSAKLAEQALDETNKRIEHAAALQNLKSTNPLANLQTELKTLKELAAASKEFAEGNEARLRERLALTPKTEQNGATIRALIGDIAESEAKRANLAPELARKIELAYGKQEAAVRSLAVAERERVDAELEANEAFKGNQTKSLIDSTQEYKRGIDEANEATELELSLGKATEQARAIAIAQFQETLKLRRLIAQIDAAPIIGTREEVAATRATQIGIAEGAAAKAKADIEAKIVGDAYRAEAKSIEDAIYGALTGGAKSASDYIKNLFRNLSFKLFLDPILKPITGAIAAAVLGGAPGQAAASGIGTVASFANLFGSGPSSISGAITAGFSTIATSGIGRSLGLSSAIDYGTGYTANIASSGATSFGSAIGAAAPYALAAAAIYSIAKSLDKSGTPHLGSVVTADALGVRTGGDDPQNILRNLNAQTDTALKTIAGSSINTLNALADAFGGGRFTATAKFAADGVDASIGAFALSRGGQTVAGSTNTTNFSKDREAAFTAFTADVAKTVRSALDAIDLPQWARDQIAALGDSADGDKLTTVANAISQTQAAITAFQSSLRPLGGTFTALASLTGDAVFALSNLSGGIDKLSGNVKTYYDNFYSEAERTAMATSSVTAALAAVGVALPASRDAFRALVETQLALGDAGRPAVAALLGVAGAFADLTVAAADLSEALADAIADALPKFETPAQTTTRQYQEVSTSLNKVGVAVDVGTLLAVSKAEIESFARSFVSLSGNTDEAKLAVLKAASALADLKDSAAEAAAKLQEEADAKRAEIAATGVDLQIELLRAQGKEQAAVNAERALELAALRELDPALASVKESIYAATDAAVAAASLAARQRSLASGVDSVIGDFLKGADLARYKAGRIQETLADGGIDASVPSILGATTADVRELWEAVGIDGKEAILAAYGAFKDLQDILYGTANAVAAYRAGTLADNIEQARLATLTPADRIASLKSTESTLFAQLSTSDDPVAVAEKLQRVIVSRISEESSLRDSLADNTKNSLEEQLDAVKRLKDLSQEIGQFTGSLKFGDSSPLSRPEQLGAAESLFSATLAGAQSGDQFAQGNLLANARSLIDEAISAYGSGPQAAEVFDRVTRELDQFGELGTQADAQAGALQAQIDNLPTIAGNTTDMLTALESIDAALAGRLGLSPDRSDADLIAADLQTAVLPNASNTAADIQAQSTAQLVAQSTHLAQIAIHAAQTSANTAAAVAVDREGFLQAVAELKAMNAQQAAILNELRVGAVPA